MKRISIFERAGAFAENKDVAKDIREREILPALAQGEDLVLDFGKVDAATQSFIHALISEAIRRHGPAVLDKIVFKSCGDAVKKIVAIVTDYMQDS